MFRVFVAVVLGVLIIGPLLLQAGVLEHAGGFRDFVETEVKMFELAANWIRFTVGGGRHA